MYIFVRFTAVFTIVVGVLLMVLGIFVAIYGAVQNDAVTLWINASLEAANDVRRVVNAGYSGVIIGTISVIVGMVTSAIGQLLLVFVDLATHTRETNIILRSFRPRSPEKQPAIMDDDDMVYG